MPLCRRFCRHVWLTFCVNILPHTTTPTPTPDLLLKQRDHCIGIPPLFAPYIRPLRKIWWFGMCSFLFSLLFSISESVTDILRLWIHSQLLCIHFVPFPKNLHHHIKITEAEAALGVLHCHGCFVKLRWSGMWSFPDISCLGCTLTQACTHAENLLSRLMC